MSTGKLRGPLPQHGQPAGTDTAAAAVDLYNMMDPMAFLLAKAEEIRDLAGRNAELAHALRRLAEECEARAEELGQDRRRGASS